MQPVGAVGKLVRFRRCVGVYTNSYERKKAHHYHPAFLAQTTRTNSCGVDLKPAAILFPSIPQYLLSTLPPAPSF